MYMLNDMELLVNLGKLGILKHVLSQCAITISAVKLRQGYSYQLGQQVENFCVGVQQLYSDEGFCSWKIGKGRMLSIGDLDTLYLATCMGSTLVLSDDDFALREEAARYRIPNEPVGNFIRRIIKDENVIKLFALLGKAQ
jgi:hypothetical protein